LATPEERDLDNHIANIILEPFSADKEPPPIEIVEEWKNDVLREIAERNLIVDNLDEFASSVSDIYEHLQNGYAVRLMVIRSTPGYVKVKATYTNDPDELEAIQTAKDSGLSSNSTDYLRAIHEQRNLKWPDGKFCFSCTHCGKCCENVGCIFLRPSDVMLACEELGLSTRDFIERFCVFDIESSGTAFTILRYRKEDDDTCIMFDKEKRECILPLGVRPVMCRLYPVARQFTRGKGKEELLADAAHRAQQDQEDMEGKDNEGGANPEQLTLLVNMPPEKCHYFWDRECPGTSGAGDSDLEPVTIQQFMEMATEPEEVLLDNIFFSLVLALDLIFDKGDSLQVAPFLVHALYHLDEPIFPVPGSESTIDLEEGLRRRTILSYALSKGVYSGLVAEEGDLNKIEAVMSSLIGQMMSIWQIFTYGVDLWGNMTEEEALDTLDQMTELLNICADELGEIAIPRPNKQQITKEV